MILFFPFHVALDLALKNYMISNNDQRVVFQNDLSTFGSFWKIIVWSWNSQMFTNFNFPDVFTNFYYLRFHKAQKTRLIAQGVKTKIPW